MEQLNSNGQASPFYWINEYWRRLEIFYELELDHETNFAKYSSFASDMVDIGKCAIDEIHTNLIKCENDFSLKNYLTLIQRVIRKIERPRIDVGQFAVMKSRMDQVEERGELIYSYSPPYFMEIKGIVNDIINSREILKDIPTYVEMFENSSQRIIKDKLTHKQQVLLLNQLGFFKMDFFTSLNETQKGILVSHILNRDDKNTEDNIRYVGGKNSDESRKIRNKSNVEAVNSVLEKVGLDHLKANEL